MTNHIGLSIAERATSLLNKNTVADAKAAPKRDPAGFEELAMPLFNPLYNFARWLSHDQNEAEDLVQEAYLRALRSFASFESGTNFRAWMFRILRNTFLNSCSQLERPLTVAMDSEDVPVLPATAVTPESLLIGHYSNHAVRRAIEQLPITFREVILLCDVEEASYREIAEILSIPIETVMSRLARARMVVRSSLRRSPSAQQPAATRNVSIDQEAVAEKHNPAA